MNEQEKVLVWIMLEQDGALLLGRRKADEPPFAGRWTLPGDVMAVDESSTETLERFAHDQLDVRVEEEEFVETLFLSDGGQEYAVNVFRVRFSGNPRFRESGPFQDVRWFLRADLDAMGDVVREIAGLGRGNKEQQ